MSPTTMRREPPPLPNNLRAPYRQLRTETRQRDTHGPVILLAGARGSGKTTLLDRLAFECEPTRSVLRFELDPTRPSRPYGLAVDMLSQLPDAPADILDRELTHSDLTDRLAVSTACAVGLAALAPLILIVDHAQLMDPESRDVLTFVVNRSRPGDLVVVLAVADLLVNAHQLPDGPTSEVTLPPLTVGEATGLLEQHHPNLPLPIRQRLLDESQGLPLALLEYADMLTEQQLTDRALLPTFLPLSRRLSTLYGHFMDGMAARLRHEVLLHALDISPQYSTGSQPMRWNPDDQDGALLEAAGLAHFHPVDGMLFTSRLVINTICQGATAAETAEVQAQLAAIYRSSPIRYAIHAGASVQESDDEIAADLHRASLLLKGRQRLSAALTTLVRAAELSTDLTVRSRRLVEAGELAADAGRLPLAETLRAQASSLNSNTAESVRQIIARAASVRVSGGNAWRVMESLQYSLDQNEATSAYETNEAILALVGLGLVIDEPAAWERIRDYADASRPLLEPLTVAALTVALPAEFVRLDVPVNEMLAAAFDASQSGWRPQQVSHFMSALHSAEFLGHYRAMMQTDHDRFESGGPAILGLEIYRAIAAFQAGMWDAAEHIATTALRNATGEAAARLSMVLALLFAARGDAARTHEICNRIAEWGAPRGSSFYRAMSGEARLLVALTTGDSAAAQLHASSLLVDDVLPLWPHYASRTILDVTYAYQSVGNLSDARRIATAAHNAANINHPGRIQFMSTAAMAIVAPPEDAENHYQQALTACSRGEWPFEAAQIELYFGEWLRKQMRLSEARQHLGDAALLFTSLGAHQWAERASHALRAAGKPSTPQPNGITRDDDTTPLLDIEVTIAQLAAAGLTNKEIGERLHLSPRTISNHLYRIFPKLGITARSGLRDALRADQ